jgi:protein TIF31
MSAQEVKPEAVAEAVPEKLEAAEATEASEEQVAETVPPVVVRLPKPSNARTLPPPVGDETYSQLTLLSQPSETVQELKLAVSEWVGGYWLGPYSLRLPGQRGGEALGVSKEGIEIRAGEKLSEWLEVGDVFAHTEEARELEVVKGV